MRRAQLIATTTVGSGLTAWLVGRAVAAVADDRNAPWLLGRASGVTSYLLLVVLVGTGLVLSHPHRERWRRPSAPLRIRVHVSLAVFTLTFTVLHVVVLATDEYAKVGWAGALVPMRSEYRPVAVTTGVIGLYAGLLAGVTAAFAGRWAARVWWPIHKVAASVLVLLLAHAVFAGSDTAGLTLFYAATSAVLIGLAAWRYLAVRPSDLEAPIDPVTAGIALPRGRR